MIHDLSTMTSPEAHEAVQRSQTAVIPVGSIEQHGPHLPNGTDTFAAKLIARGVAERMDAVYVPFSPYGVSPIHAGHPGTVSLRPETFEALLTDVCAELIAAGVRTVVLVNWHEGNISSMNRVATELQDRHKVVFVAAQACYTAQRIYRPEGGELTHGGGIETLAVLAQDKELVKVERAGEPTRPEGAHELDAMRRSPEVYGFVTDVSELADAGWYGDPTWASTDRAGTFVDDVANEVVRLAESVVAAHRSRG
ncbi:MAG TPA: creatininase family protein [Nocardioidaceae bacterium]|nr:creatininase family protein [Nocardioidaceae bacterium]